MTKYIHSEFEMEGHLHVLSVPSKGEIMEEFVLFNKQGERIDGVSPYYMHKVVGDKVLVSNDRFEYELSLENGNTFEIVKMGDWLND